MIRISLLTLFISLLAGCSSVQTQVEHLNISISHSDVSSWLNLMPPGPASFHITGTLSVANEEEYEIAGLSLNEITIFQENESIYFFKPEFETEDDNSKPVVIKAGEVINYRFYKKNGLIVKENLDPEKRISANLKFNLRDNVFEYVIPDIQIEKAY
jgi:hypothetical protein